jgi:hypothetical protein
MYDAYLSRGQQICFSNPSIRVMAKLEASGFINKIGREHFFACLHDAVQFCLNAMDSEAMSMHESVNGNDIGDAAALDEEAPIDIEADSNY